MVEASQQLLKLLLLWFRRQIALADHQQIGEYHLFDRLILSGQLLKAIDGIDNGHHPVEAIALGDEVILSQGKEHRGRVGKARGLYDETPEWFDLLAQGPHE